MIGYTRVAGVEVQGLHDLFQKLQGAALALAVFKLRNAFLSKSSALTKSS